MDKSKELQVIVKAKELAEHTIRKTSNCKNFPKKYRFTLVDKMQVKSLQIYEKLMEANSTKLADKEKRLELQTQAITLLICSTIALTKFCKMVGLTLTVLTAI